MSNYIIGSFNIRDFSLNASKDIKMISQIIKNEKFDIIAIQEVEQEEAIGELLLNLNNGRNGKWKQGYDYPKNNRNTHKEGYAFIWNSDRIDLVSDNKKPKIYYPKKDNALIRPPLVGRFTPRGKIGGSSFEIRLLNVHLISSSSEKVMGIKKELLSTINQIMQENYNYKATERDGENMPSYTFLLGDYNLTLNQINSTFGMEINPKIDTNYFRLDQLKKARSIKHTQEKKTSLKNHENNENTTKFNSKTECYNENFDHFSYSEDLDEKLSIKISRVDALENYYKHIKDPNECLKTYKNEISDHVPIKLEIDLKKNIGGRIK